MIIRLNDWQVNKIHLNRNTYTYDFVQTTIASVVYDQQ